jgi:hypothetical protein
LADHPAPKSNLVAAAATIIQQKYNTHYGSEFAYEGFSGQFLPGLIAEIACTLLWFELSLEVCVLHIFGLCLCP